MLTKTFTEGSVTKLFFRYLIPSVCGTMVTSIYIFADTIIIGKGLGLNALAALNIILPLFNLFFGTGLLFGVGGSVLMSISRGRGEFEKGNAYYTAAFLLNLLFCLIYTAILLCNLKKVALFLGATEATLPYVMEYIPYISFGLTAFSFSSFLQTFIRNDGAPKLAMTAVVAGGVFNVIFDIVFVYYMNFGMAGASIASVGGALTTNAVLILHFFSKKNNIQFTLAGFKLSYMKDIFANGFTSFLIEIGSGIVMFVFNIQLVRYVGDIGVSLYGVISNSAIMLTCICNGITQAAQPILSINHGAGKKERVEKLKKLGLITSFVVGSIPAIAGLIVPDLFTNIFLNPTAEILAISSGAIRTYFLAFFVTGINLFIIGYFQSIIQPAASMLLCLLRGCMLSILFVFILPIILGPYGIWITIPLAELITTMTGVCLLKKTQSRV